MIVASSTPVVLNWYVWTQVGGSAGTQSPFRKQGSVIDHGKGVNGSAQLSLHVNIVNDSTFDISIEYTWH